MDGRARPAPATHPSRRARRAGAPPPLGNSDGARAGAGALRGRGRQGASRVGAPGQRSTQATPVRARARERQREEGCGAWVHGVEVGRARVRGRKGRGEGRGERMPARTLRRRRASGPSRPCGAHAIAAVGPRVGPRPCMRADGDARAYAVSRAFECLIGVCGRGRTGARAGVICACGCQTGVVNRILVRLRGLARARLGDHDHHPHTLAAGCRAAGCSAWLEPA